ncbi:hypothetical protein B9Q02_12235 [Candidatus Marsarchaeota G1 archaeon BE_D]|uniref:C2HC/C3H-type domain-containing protein n=1 Tax=Candidatus Marsarchaeota G1 archaeon BE_D TaxID=1978156 RepID=A0A2R6A6D6_9ARCH|nr:MAG: hypothetical protein B9Q02_12235 [Candidatus Marsarchaeota G1 archaeon BE_D]
MICFLVFSMVMSEVIRMAGIRIYPLVKCPVCGKKYSATYLEKHIRKCSEKK